MLQGKINKIRTIALMLIFTGIAIMYLGFVFPPRFLLFFFILGLLSILSSIGIYFWIGIISTKAYPIICPVCDKQTKILGKKDECMHCKAILSLDPLDNNKN